MTDLNAQAPQLGRHPFAGYEEAHAALRAAGFFHVPRADMNRSRHYRWIGNGGRVIRCDVTPPLNPAEGGVVAFVWAATS